MFIRFFLSLFIFINISLNLWADEKQLIINRIIDINNLTFEFEQTLNNKKEIGLCNLVFDNKLSCDYEDSIQKRILINAKTLIVLQKRYGKKQIYPISKSPFIKIFNKNNLINLIKESSYELGENIMLTYIGKNKEKIIIFFNKDSYNLAGWRVVDQLQNVVNFSIKIKRVNSKINPNVFKLPAED